jgi:hypothetical protein
LFAPKEAYSSVCDVKQVVIDRIELLESVNKKAENWRELIDGRDPNNTFSASERTSLETKLVWA